MFLENVTKFAKSVQGQMTSIIKASPPTYLSDKNIKYSNLKNNLSPKVDLSLCAIKPWLYE